MSRTRDKIETTDRQSLLSMWQKDHNGPAPKGISQSLLKLSATYHIQAKGTNGKAKRIDKSLLNSSSPNSSKALQPGTVLLRQWHGNPYKVEVLEEGFLLNGKTYQSLSEIARFITGARWSGPRFFGLGNKQ